MTAAASPTPPGRPVPGGLGGAGVPVPDLDAPDFAPYWRGCREGRLLVQRCANGHLSWPPRPACPRCHDLTRDWVPVPGAGSLYSWTVVHRTPMSEFAARTPYVVAVVELRAEPVLRMVGRCLGDPATLYLGMPLEVRFEAVNERFSVPVWLPAGEPATREEHP